MERSFQSSQNPVIQELYKVMRKYTNLFSQALIECKVV